METAAAPRHERAQRSAWAAEAPLKAVEGRRGPRKAAEGRAYVRLGSMSTAWTQ